MSGRPGTDPAAPGVILVMGVSGSGKTTVGRALAGRLGASFIEADDYHSAANVARMHSGVPLDDEARWPWLRSVHDAVVAAVRQSSTGQVVVACSALKAAYRDVLLAGLENVAVVFLSVDRSTLDDRLRHRPRHYMPATLLDSQLRDLEPPGDAIVVKATGGIDATVDQVMEALGPAAGEASSR